MSDPSPEHRVLQRAFPEARIGPGFPLKGGICRPDIDERSMAEAHHWFVEHALARL
ncbi:MAG: hypothetical protein QM756_20940 [Polyangiaceae bacterium]